MRRGLVHVLVFSVLSAALFASTAAADAPDTRFTVRDPDVAGYTAIGGASPLATDVTVPHWHGQFTDPANGVSYGYNMVGAEDPRNAGAGTTVVPVDIIPLRLSFEANNGFALDGTNEVGLTLASPIFQGNDYSSTPHSFGGAGPLSSGNVGVQYADAVMRSQFNKTGTSYHLVLEPHVLPTPSYSVPVPKGTAYINTQGVIFGAVDTGWLLTRIQELVGQLQLDPTRLAIFLTDDVFVTDRSGFYLGFHSADRAAQGNGQQAVHTYIYATYLQAGLFREVVENVKDVHTLSHEIAEWAADPFINNTIASTYWNDGFGAGCLDVLEVGDPALFLGFDVPGNPDPRPHTTGTWHLQDEVFLSWFSGEAPNLTAQPTQSGRGGRYTFMGDLNPLPIFRAPAPHC
jgi:hypothetical protein